MYDNYPNDDIERVAKESEGNNWLTSILIVVFSSFFLAFAMTIGSLWIAIPLAFIFCLAGFPYALIAALYTVIKGRRSNLTKDSYDPRFRNVPQQVTFLLSVILLLNLFLGVLTLGIGGSQYLYISAIVALSGATLSIGFNAPTIFGRVADIERAVIRDKA